MQKHIQHIEDILRISIFFGFLLLVVGCWLLVAPAALAQTSYSIPTLGVTDLKGPEDLAKLILQYAVMFVGVAGLAAFIWGGVRYLTAAGNPSQAQDAKDRLIHALLGLLVVGFAGITLRLINPDFYTFGDVGTPSVGFITSTNFAGAPPGGYLSCREQAAGVYACGVGTKDSCGEDEQCVPCIGRIEGQVCTPRPTEEEPFELLSCVPDLPCLGGPGTCPSNFPCSDITGGRQSDWTVVSDTACQDPQRPVECIDETAFDAATHACCALETQGIPAAGTPPDSLQITCSASPNPAQANREEGVSFGIKGNGSGFYDCKWTGAFEAVGCNPNFLIPLPGVYTETVEVIDRGYSQKAVATCSANVVNYPLSITNTRTERSGISGVRFCPDDPWRIDGSFANRNEPVFIKVWKDGELVQDWLFLEKGIPDPLNNGEVPAYTDDGGNWSPSGAFKPYLIASWQIQTAVRGVESAILQFEIKPCMRITNQATGQVQNTIEFNPAFQPFCVEDPWRLDVIGPTSTDVWGIRKMNGQVFTDWENWSPPQTDPETGYWLTTDPGFFNRCLIGDWVEQVYMYDADDVQRFSDELKFSIKPCLDVSCDDLTVNYRANRPPSTVTNPYAITGHVDGDADLADPHGFSAVPPELHVCQWNIASLVQGPRAENEPPSDLCAQTDPISDNAISAGTHTVRLQARDEMPVSCASFPVVADVPEWTEATCALTVCAADEVACGSACETPVCYQWNPDGSPASDSACADEFSCTFDYCDNGFTCGASCSNPLRPGWNFCDGSTCCNTGAGNICCGSSCQVPADCSSCIPGVCEAASCDPCGGCNISPIPNCTPSPAAS
ncbi:MAG: pilin [bacterium]|nr:pilin [bacterium]